jgi:hypothetical protein
MSNMNNLILRVELLVYIVESLNIFKISCVVETDKLINYFFL